MDIAYLFEDVYAATAAARHVEKKLQKVSEEKGYLPEVCSYARTTLGAAYFPEAEKPGADPYYLMPPPDFLVCVDPGCSMLPWWSDAGRRHFQKPLFTVQVPLVWNKGDEEEAVHELTQQYRDLVAFLEDITHTHLDWEWFRRIMADVQAAITYRMEALDLSGRAVPAPATFFDWAASLGVTNYALGTPLGTEMYRQIRDEVRDRVANHVGALEEERVRVYWEGHMCWPYMRWWGELLNRLGINVVAAKYTHLCFWHRPDKIDPARPLESMAWNSITALGYSAPLLAEEILRFCRDYSIDAVICHLTYTCRIFPGPFFEVMDIITRKLGIPGTFFDGDVADGSFFASAQAEDRVESLVQKIGRAHV
jgi:benzoyl-CoA reductase subunit B